MDMSYELLDIIKQLHIVTGYHISIKDVNFKLLAKYPAKNSSYCSLIQTNPCALEECKKCDIKAMQTVSDSREIFLYRCHAGLYEAVCPIFYFGSLSGFLIMGQMVTSDDDSVTRMVSNGKHFISDEQELCNAAKNISSITLEKISALSSIMNMCAGYLTLSNRLKVSGRSPDIEAVEYINDHITDTIRLDDLCNHCFCSKTTLSAAFKKKYGMTITTYITKIRMQRAAKLLKDSPHLPINTVASKCGIDDANYFSKLFAAEYGMPPSKYKNLGDE